MLNFTLPGFISAVANIIFPLLIFFEWLRGYSRENVIKNNLIAVHRIISRIDHQEATGALDILDATLATIGARRPFEDWAEQKITQIKNRFLAKEKENLREAPDVQSKPI